MVTLNKINESTIRTEGRSKHLQAANKNRQGSRVFSHDHVARSNTGTQIDDEVFIESERRQATLVEQTERLGAVLEQFGVCTRLGSDLCALPAVTPSDPSFIDSWRPLRFLPIVAQRDRRPMLNALQYFHLHHPKAKYWRYSVVSSGQRIALYGDLRERTQKMQRTISKAASECDQDFDVEFILRVTEWTIDERLTFNIHSNVVSYPRVRMQQDIWASYLSKLHERFNHWQDCGILNNPEEVLKYPFKPADVMILADAAAYFVSQWRDREVSHHELCESFRRIVRQHIDKVGGRTVAADDPEVVARVDAAMENAHHVLTTAYERGADHPLLWLFKQTSTHIGDNGKRVGGIKIAQPLGAFKAFRAELEEKRLKVGRMNESLGSKKIRCLVEKPARNPRQSVPQGQSTSSEKMPSENIVLTMGLPQTRWSPWCEPAIYVLNYTEQPTTQKGKQGLEIIEGLKAKARSWWNQAQAPEPEYAAYIGNMLLHTAGLRARASATPIALFSKAKHAQSEPKATPQGAQYNLDTVRSTVWDKLSVQNEGRSVRNALVHIDGSLRLDQNGVETSRIIEQLTDWEINAQLDAFASSELAAMKDPHDQYRGAVAGKLNFP